MMTNRARPFTAVMRCPTALAVFPAEFLPWPPRSTIERHYNVQQWRRRCRQGGHFAAWEEPGLLLDDLRKFHALVH